MTERSPKEVLDGIPGWEGAAYGELAGGLTNRAWLVKKDGKRAVLKIDHNPRVEGVDDKRVNIGVLHEVPLNTSRHVSAINNCAANRRLRQPKCSTHIAHEPSWVFVMRRRV